MANILFSPQVVYQPWIGESYSSQTRKILFLGESHYDVDIDELLFTTEVIRRQFGEGQDIGDKVERYRLTKNLELLFSENHKLDVRKTKKFWSEVSFYNFVQAYLVSSEARPNRTQFASSVSPFCEVVCALKPDIVVVLGFTTWDHLPKDHRLDWKQAKMQREIKSPVLRTKRALEIWRGRAKHEQQEHSFWSFFLPHLSYQGLGPLEAWASWPRNAFEEIARLDEERVHGVCRDHNKQEK
jgi:hypothetical protein